MYSSTTITVYETLKRRGFDPDDIASLVEYLDDHRRRTMQPVLDQIHDKFEQMETRFEAKFEHFDAKFDAKFEHFEDRFDGKLNALRAEMVSRKEAWGFLVVIALMVTFLPEVFDQGIELLRALP